MPTSRQESQPPTERIHQLTPTTYPNQIMGQSQLVPVPDPTLLTTQQLLREISTIRELVTYQIDGITSKIETRLAGNDKAVELIQANANKFPDQITAAVNHLKNLHEEKFRSFETQFTERDLRSQIIIEDSKNAIGSALQASDKAIQLAQSNADKAIQLVQANADKLPNIIHGSISQLQSLHEERFKSIATQFLERDVRTEQTSKDSKVAVDAALQAAKEAVDQQNKSNALAIAKSETTFTKQIDQIGALISTLQKGLDDKIDDLKSRVQSLESTKKGSSDTLGFIIGALGMIVAVISGMVSIISRLGGK